jgi:hypothetical protein
MIYVTLKGIKRCLSKDSVPLKECVCSVCCALREIGIEDTNKGPMSLAFEIMYENLEKYAPEECQHLGYG